MTYAEAERRVREGNGTGRTEQDRLRVGENNKENNIAASSNERVQADLQKLQPMQELGAVQWLQQEK